MKKLLMILSVLVVLSGCCSIISKKNKDISGKGPDKEIVLILSAVIRIESLDEVVFILKAERIKENEDEYLPSSEDYRVEIISKKGITLWSSNHNRAFMQSIGTVKPVTTGETYYYKMTWDGLTNDRKKLPEGNYKVRMTIPSRPQAYSIEKEMEWKQTDE